VRLEEKGHIIVGKEALKTYFKKANMAAEKSQLKPDDTVCLEVFDWLSGVPLADGQKPFDVIEARFKNGRKAFFRKGSLELFQGDVIAVEASTGYDVGIVSLAGELVRIQMNRRDIKDNYELKRVLRKAEQSDFDTWQAARQLETSTMIRSREISRELGLQMKISDVEYQGDKTRAIFYYTADDRVDFRELIRKYAEEFKVRIEMRQIGLRLEAGRLGGIGSCGRELCCSTWLTDFRSVSTGAARYQQLSLNPGKLAGQCGKLKCCLTRRMRRWHKAHQTLLLISRNLLKHANWFVQRFR
jgi:cell fate regulator YaaT (PSP1 superfamily)